MAAFRPDDEALTPEALERVLSKYSSQEDALVRWLRQADEAGALSVPDVALAAEVFWGMAGGALFWPRLVGESTSLPERLIPELVELFLARYRPA